MTISHMLEDFAHEQSNGDLTVNRAMLEEERLSAFEQGYQAGWDDSLEAANGSEKKVLKDILEALLSLSLSQQEIYGELLVNMRPFLNTLVDFVLPTVLKGTLGIHVKSIIDDHIKENGECAVSISVANGKAEILKESLPHSPGFHVNIVEDSSIEDSQVRINFTSGDEKEVDPDQLLTEVKSLIEDFFKNEVSTVKEAV